MYPLFLKIYPLFSVSAQELYKVKLHYSRGHAGEDEGGGEGEGGGED